MKWPEMWGSGTILCKHTSAETARNGGHQMGAQGMVGSRPRNKPVQMNMGPWRNWGKDLRMAGPSSLAELRGEGTDGMK